MADQPNLPVQDFIYVSTPDVCAVCGQPSVGVYVIQKGKGVTIEIGLKREWGGVRAKLCQKHVDELRASKAPRRAKNDPEQPRLL